MRIFSFISLLLCGSLKASIFSTAIESNDIEHVKSLIDIGCNVNIGYIEDSSDDGYPPLFEALIFNKLEIMLLLLNEGANPNIYILSNGGLDSNHILSEAISAIQIILLLSFGSDPYIDNNWPINQIESDQMTLHTLIFSYWNFEAAPLNPKNLNELNEIFFSLPILRITSLHESTLLLNADITDFSVPDQKLLELINFH